MSAMDNWFNDKNGTLELDAPTPSKVSYFHKNFGIAFIPGLNRWVFWQKQGAFGTAATLAEAKARIDATWLKGHL